MRLLLISNGQVQGMGYLEHAERSLAAFLPPEVRQVLLVPYASVTRGYDDCVRDLFPLLTETLGRNVVGLHTMPDPHAAVRDAQAIFVRGGNTWQLVKTLRSQGLLSPIREAVKRGTPYVGWSAGANIACPTMATTNDMPIADPGGLDTLGLVPFQINPHYLDGGPADHTGETRETRILEYLELHHDITVVGMREGLMFRLEDDSITLEGRADRTVRVFRYGSEPQELGIDADFRSLVRG